jgi:hypothetical protein
MTNISAAIRGFVRSNAGTNYQAVVDAVGASRKYVGAKLLFYVREGAMHCDATGGFTWNNDYVVRPRGGSVPKGERLRGFRAAGRTARRKRKPIKDGRRGGKVKSMADLARKVCGDDLLVLTPIGHVMTALNAFEQTIDVGSLEPMALAAWRSLHEAVGLAGRG